MTGRSDPESASGAAEDAAAPVRIARVEAQVFRVPLERPVATSFGTMRDRPAVFVRLTDADGAFGWGEIFANWPAAGAEHRARLLMEDLGDLVLGLRARAPSDLFHALDAKTRVRALQCGEPGPFAQGIAGLDIALHDLFARRAGVPLARLLDPSAAETVAAYASGIHVAAAARAIGEARAAGHRAFKVKVGFDRDEDVAMLGAAAEACGDGEQLFADANQAWDADEALGFLEATAEVGLGWLEEPIVADAPEASWARLARASSVPLAGGENIAGLPAFEAAIAAGSLSVLQPDVAKWGGVTGCGAVARAAIAAGRRYCPHFLGGGIGLAASAHLLAAVGGDGLLEMDVNPNPLRDAFEVVRGRVADGRFRLSDAPGLGIEELPEEIGRYRTLALSRHV